MITCTRRIEWDAAHRVLRHESKCATLHGHRYRADITCARTGATLDDLQRVVDFGVIKERVGGWVDRRWDHRTLVNVEDKELLAFVLKQTTCENDSYYAFEGEPTAENIARELLDVANTLLKDTGIWVTRVRVWETPNCWAEVVV